MCLRSILPGKNLPWPQVWQATTPNTPTTFKILVKLWKLPLKITLARDLKIQLMFLVEFGAPGIPLLQSRLVECGQL